MSTPTALLLTFIVLWLALLTAWLFDVAKHVDVNCSRFDGHYHASATRAAGTGPPIVQNNDPRNKSMEAQR